MEWTTLWVNCLLYCLYILPLWSSSHSTCGTKKYALVDEIYMSDVYPFMNLIKQQKNGLLEYVEMTWSVSGVRSLPQPNKQSELFFYPYAMLTFLGRLLKSRTHTFIELICEASPTYDTSCVLLGARDINKERISFFSIYVDANME